MAVALDRMHAPRKMMRDIVRLCELPKEKQSWDVGKRRSARFRMGRILPFILQIDRLFVPS